MELYIEYNRNQPKAILLVETTHEYEENDCELEHRFDYRVAMYMASKLDCRVYHVAFDIDDEEIDLSNQQVTLLNPENCTFIVTNLNTYEMRVLDDPDMRKFLCSLHRESIPKEEYTKVRAGVRTQGYVRSNYSAWHRTCHEFCTVTDLDEIHFYCDPDKNEIVMHTILEQKHRLDIETVRKGFQYKTILYIADRLQMRFFIHSEDDNIFTPENYFAKRREFNPEIKIIPIEKPSDRIDNICV